MYRLYSRVYELQPMNPLSFTARRSETGETFWVLVSSDMSLFTTACVAVPQTVKLCRFMVQMKVCQASVRNGAIQIVSFAPSNELVTSE